MCFPIASILAIQIALLLVFVLASGIGISIYWFYLPLIWALELAFVCGAALFFSALNVYVRDTRYFVESSILVLFWMVPIFYPFSLVPQRFAELYQLNPVAALVLAMRNVVLDGQAPAERLLVKLALVSFLALGAGFLMFRQLKPRFYDHL